MPRGHLAKRLLADLMLIREHEYENSLANDFILSVSKEVAQRRMRLDNEARVNAAAGHPDEPEIEEPPLKFRQRRVIRDRQFSQYRLRLIMIADEIGKGTRYIPHN